DTHTHTHTHKHTNYILYIHTRNHTHTNTHTHTHYISLSLGHYYFLPFPCSLLLLPPLLSVFVIFLIPARNQQLNASAAAAGVSIVNSNKQPMEKPIASPPPQHSLSLSLPSLSLS